MFLYAFCSPLARLSYVEKTNFPSSLSFMSTISFLIFQTLYFGSHYFLTEPLNNSVSSHLEVLP